MENFTNNLANWLPGVIRQKNFNVSTFCARIGLTRRAYYNYLEDKMRPSKATLLKMCEALDIAPKEIFEHIQYNKLSYGHHSIEDYPKHNPKLKPARKLKLGT